MENEENKNIKADKAQKKNNIKIKDFGNISGEQ